MKRRLLLLLAALFAFTLAFASHGAPRGTKDSALGGSSNPAIASPAGDADAWQQQAITPTGIDLNNVFFLTATEGWAVGYSGLILHTTDGGATWEVQRLADPAEVLRTVFFKDALHGWVGGQNMLFTEDGGRTWQQSVCTVFCQNEVWSFLDNFRGFGTASGNPPSSRLVRTTDGGRNWVRESFLIPINRIQFFDGLNGVAFAAQIAGTTDGGQTWTVRPGSTNGGASSAGSAFFLDFNRAWRINNSDFSGGFIQQTIDRTTDGGQTWTRVTPPAGTFVSNLYFLDAMNGWGVGSNENIIRTSDGGLSWQTQKGGRGSAIENYYALSRVTFADALHGTAIGGGGSIYTTADGGQTWTHRTNGSKMRALKIFALDSQTAWVGHETGHLTYTTDGGRFWHRAQVMIGAGPADASVVGLTFTDAQNGWAVTKGRIGGAFETVYRTSDGGKNWQHVANSPDFNAFGLDVVGNTIVGVGFDGGGAPIVRSNDGGQTWINYTFPGTSTLRDVDMVTETLGYIAGSGWLLKTTDGGATWQTLRTGASWVSISFADPLNGWSVAVNGNGFKEIWHTSDGGITWDIKPRDNVVSVHAVDAQTAWVAIADYTNFRSSALRTTDGGQTYTEESVATQTVLDDIFFVDAETGWASGVNTNIYSNASNAGGAIYRRGETTTPLHFVSAVSRKTHGAAGTFDIALPFSGDPGVEPRRNANGDQTIVFTFSNDVVSGNAAVTDGGGRLSGTPTFSGNTMTVRLTGVPAAGRVTVTLSGVTDSFAQTMPSTDLTIKALFGDTDGNGSVSASDIGRVKSEASNPVTATNFRSDVTADGAVSSSDIGAVKSMAGATVP